MVRQLFCVQEISSYMINKITTKESNNNIKNHEELGCFNYKPTPNPTINGTHYRLVPRLVLQNLFWKKGYNKIDVCSSEKEV